MSVCNNGCPSVHGKNKRFVAYMPQKTPNAIIVHCIIHREALVTKPLPKDLQNVMNQASQVVNSQFVELWILSASFCCIILRGVGFLKGVKH